MTFSLFHSVRPEDSLYHKLTELNRLLLSENDPLSVEHLLDALRDSSRRRQLFRLLGDSFRGEDFSGDD